MEFGKYDTTDTTDFKFCPRQLVTLCSTSCHPDGHAQASEVLRPRHLF